MGAEASAHNNLKYSSLVVSWRLFPVLLHMTGIIDRKSKTDFYLLNFTKYKIKDD